MSDHGTSQITFMKKVKSAMTTIIVIEDEKGFKFGAFCLEEWKHGQQFYGESETMVFSFGTNLN